MKILWWELNTVYCELKECLGLEQRNEIANHETRRQTLYVIIQVGDGKKERNQNLYFHKSIQ